MRRVLSLVVGDDKNSKKCKISSMNMDKPKVYVAMSGGVDSSVAAALLKRAYLDSDGRIRIAEGRSPKARYSHAGFDVVGVFFKPWQPKQVTGYRLQVTGNCMWENDRRDAMRVCAKLGIPFKTWDFSREYGKQVAQYMIDSYRAGITPNPDVMCNKEIKFGLFLKKAFAEGADYIATGHYARKREIKNQSTQSIECSAEHRAHNALCARCSGQKSKIKNINQNPKSEKLLTTHYSLLTGVDKNKDQSYFLWTLTQKQLKHCLFPIGDYAKPEIRKLAKKFGLPNHDKKDSQGVCFVGQLNMKDFLKNYIKPSRGEIRLLSFTHDRNKMKGSKKYFRDTGEKIVGFHDGTFYYTIGQRHGLDIKDGGGPYYVVSKDTKRNIIYVANTASSHQLSASNTEIKNVNWVSSKPKLPLDCQIKIRYRTKSVPVTITRTALVQGRPLYKVRFKKPVRALTPGQSAVIYRGQEVLGGGVIT